MRTSRYRQKSIRYKMMIQHDSMLTIKRYKSLRMKDLNQVVLKSILTKDIT
jgi:hypothetical protein